MRCMIAIDNKYIYCFEMIFYYRSKFVILLLPVKNFYSTFWGSKIFLWALDGFSHAKG